MKVLLVILVILSVLNLALSFLIFCGVLGTASSFDRWLKVWSGVHDELKRLAAASVEKEEDKPKKTKTSKKVKKDNE